jgi:hypothetical protein
MWAKTNVLLVVAHEIDEEIFKFTGNHFALLLAVIWKIQYLAYTVLLLLSTCKYRLTIHRISIQAPFLGTLFTALLGLVSGADLQS